MTKHTALQERSEWMAKDDFVNGGTVYVAYKLINPYREDRCGNREYFYGEWFTTLEAAETFANRLTWEEAQI